MHLRETAEDVDEAISAAEELLTSLRLLVIEVWSHITSRKTQRKLWINKKKPGGGGTEHSFMPGGFVTRSNRSPFYTPFLAGVRVLLSFCIPFIIDKWYPLHIPLKVQNAAFLFTRAVYAP